MFESNLTMQKIFKCVQNYSNYPPQIFAGKTNKIAGNLPNCRQSVFAGNLPARPMSILANIKAKKISNVIVLVELGKIKYVHVKSPTDHFGLVSTHFGLNI